MLTKKDIRTKMMVSVYSTMYNDSFQYGEIKKYNPTLPLEVAKQRKLPPVRNISNENLQAMPVVPFDMMWKPEEKINRTIPARERLQRLQKAGPDRKDPGRKHAQMTRPRVLLTPAITVDNVEDDETRDTIMKMQYSTTQHAAMEEAVSLAKYKVVKAPFTGYSPPKPLYMAKWEVPVVSPEWRRETMTWDGRQLRSTPDATREFWITKHSECQPCKDTALVQNYRKFSKRS